MYATTWEGFERRAFFGQLPLDWSTLPLPLPLVILLHDEHSHLEELMLEGTADRLPGIGQQFQHLIFRRTEGELRGLPPSYARALPPPPPETFFLLAPEGSSFGRQEPLADLGGTVGGCSWNCGHRGFEARMFRPDDTGYVHHLIGVYRDRAQALIDRFDPYLDPSVPRQLVDLDRIYVVGVGNGGMMAYRLACELPSRNPPYHVRAMAILGGATGGWVTRRRFDEHHAPWVNDPADRSRFPVEPLELDLMLVHGTPDRSVPFDADDQGHRSADSTSEYDRLFRDLDNPDSAQRHTPRTFTPARSAEVWRDWLRARGGAETVHAPVTRALPQGAQRQTRHYQYPSLRSPTGSVHLWTERDDELGEPSSGSPWTPRYSPPFGAARDLWEFFKDPSRLVDWPGPHALDDLPDPLEPLRLDQLLP